MSDKQCKACGDDLFITKFDYHHYCAEEELDRLTNELAAAYDERMEREGMGFDMGLKGAGRWEL